VSLETRFGSRVRFKRSEIRRGGIPEDQLIDRHGSDKDTKVEREDSEM
jgi:hypothetical protein